ncbi:MAG: adenylate/guanylate cyclase domain-containing protein, partial [Thermoleophilaceae bacterium]
VTPPCFVSPEVEPLIETVVTVARDVEAEGGDFPSVRIGVAYGPATNRGGDWFGSTVNLASRLTATSKPGRISATEEVQALAPRSGWKRTRRGHPTARSALFSTATAPRG